MSNDTAALLTAIVARRVFRCEPEFLGDTLLIDLGRAVVEVAEAILEGER